MKGLAKVRKAKSHCLRICIPPRRLEILLEKYKNNHQKNTLLHKQYKEEKTPLTLEEIEKRWIRRYKRHLREKIPYHFYDPNLPRKELIFQLRNNHKSLNGRQNIKKIIEVTKYLN